MKKIISVLICLSILGVTACSKEETVITRSETEASTPEETTVVTESQSLDEATEELGDALEAIGGVDVDQNALTVTITFPADFVGESNQERIDQNVAEDDGLLEGTYNEDGSVTYVMTREKHQELLDATTQSMEQSLQEIVDSDDYPNVLSITHNEDYTDFTVECAEDFIGVNNSMLALEFYTFGGMYGIFTGETPDNIHVAYVYTETGEIIEEANSSDMETQ
ncbi:MAG: hypothetical protein K6F79_08630 [Saccharofermentans sp.]|nr:hypothetical protein [Saccharofermentans sp.]